MNLVPSKRTKEIRDEIAENMTKKGGKNRPRRKQTQVFFSPYIDPPQKKLAIDEFKPTNVCSPAAKKGAEVWNTCAARRTCRFLRCAEPNSQKNGAPAHNFSRPNCNPDAHNGRECIW